MSTTTILTGPERRRRWTAAEKARIVEESVSGEASAAEVARRHDIHRNQLYAWRKQARAGMSAGNGDSRLMPAGMGFSRVVVASEGGGMRVRNDTSADGAMIEVVLRNGRVLRLPQETAPAHVGALADALEGCGR